MLSSDFDHNSNANDDALASSLGVGQHRGSDCDDDDDTFESKATNGVKLQVFFGIIHDDDDERRNGIGGETFLWVDMAHI